MTQTRRGKSYGWRRTLGLLNLKLQTHRSWNHLKLIWPQTIWDVCSEPGFTADTTNFRVMISWRTYINRNKLNLCCNFWSTFDLKTGFWFGPTWGLCSWNVILKVCFSAPSRDSTPWFINPLKSGGNSSSRLKTCRDFRKKWSSDCEKIKCGISPTSPRRPTLQETDACCLGYLVALRVNAGFDFHLAANISQRTPGGAREGERETDTWATSWDDANREKETQRWAGKLNREFHRRWGKKLEWKQLLFFFQKKSTVQHPNIKHESPLSVCVCVCVCVCCVCVWVCVCVCVCFPGCVPGETNCGQTKVIKKKNSFRARHAHSISDTHTHTHTHTHTSAASLCNSSSVIHTHMDATCLSLFCTHTQTHTSLIFIVSSIRLSDSNSSPPMTQPPWCVCVCVCVCVCRHF